MCILDFSLKNCYIVFMRYHRFFVAPQMLLGRIAKIEDPEIVKQISKVLRLQLGEEIILLDGDGFEYVVRLLKIGAHEVQGEILKRHINQNEPLLKITLFQALIKKDNFEWALQKCTEVGVNSFVPLKCERTEKENINAERLKRILRETAEQSARAVVPQLQEAQDFSRALRRAVLLQAPSIILHPQGEPIKDFYKNKDLFEVNIFVGPEGGFTDVELDVARELRAEGKEVHIVSLGSRILRAETAGLVATAVLLSR